MLKRHFEKLKSKEAKAVALMTVLHCVWLKKMDWSYNTKKKFLEKHMLFSAYEDKAVATLMKFANSMNLLLKFFPPKKGHKCIIMKVVYQFVGVCFFISLYIYSIFCCFINYSIFDAQRSEGIQ